MKKQRSVKSAVYSLALLVLTLVMIISGLRILESTVFLPEENQQVIQRKTIERNGVEYFPRQDITVMLVMGIDQEGPVQSSGSYRNAGSADLVMLLIFDEQEKDCSILYLNRDTMLEMPVLGLSGKQAGTNYAQLALSHTYGSGLEDSCENTRKAVSDFLNGIAIDYYLAVNMDAIAIANDAVGGVTVWVEDDFSRVDPSIQKGEMTLWGQQAMNFVRTRKGVGDQLNLSRIQRQEAYIDSFARSFEEAMDTDANFVVKTYEAISPYLVTDCSVSTISGMLSRYEGFSIRQIITPEGENVLGKDHYEFYADEQKLDELILRLFYAPK